MYSGNTYPTPTSDMYSGNSYPTFLSPARNTIDQELLQVSTTVDGQAISADTHPLWYGDFSNVPMDSRATMDIDSWICETIRQSDFAKSYSGGGQQPPSVGDVRKIVVSEPSGSNQMYSDGQPPSVNDIRRPEPSQSEASFTCYEDDDEYEVQQVISELNDEVYNSFSELKGMVWASPPQQFQRIGTNIKVYKRGSVAIYIDITAYSGYDELIQDLARIFGLEGQLEDLQKTGWKLLYVDRDHDILILGDDPWQEFVDIVKGIKILSPQEVQQICLDGDFGGKNVAPNQACSSLVVEQFKGLQFNFQPLGNSSYGYH